MQLDGGEPEDRATLLRCAFGALFLAMHGETDILTMNHIHNPST